MKTLFYSITRPEKTLIETQLHFFRHIKMIEERLSIYTAAQSISFDAICVNATDDLSAPVLSELYKNGIRYITIRAAFNNTHDLAKSIELGIVVAHVPAYLPEAAGTIETAMLSYMIDTTFYNLHCRKKDLYSGNELTPATGLAPAAIYCR